MKNLYVFIDESGNFDFSEKGTRYFVLTAVVMENPFDLADSLNRLKYKLLLDGIFEPAVSFHASEDTQKMRDYFFDFMHSYQDMRVYAIVIDKKRWSTSGRDNQKEMYGFASKRLIEIVIKDRHHSGSSQMLVLMGAVLPHKQREEILKSLKSSIKPIFEGGFAVCFVRSASDLNCQIADYCSWAIYVKHERNELRPYRMIENKVIAEISFASL